MQSQRSIATNVAFNLAGQVAPAVAAMLALPFLLHGLGAERQGVLSLAWVAVGGLALLDFGLGRSLTLEVSRRLATGAAHDVPSLVLSTLVLLSVVGVGVSVALLVFRATVIASLSTPLSLLDEVRWALVGVAVAIPFMIVAAGLRGVLEAYGRFDLTNAVRVPLGVLTYVGPAMVLPFTSSVAAAVAALALARIAGTAALFVLVWRQIRQSGSWSPSRRHLQNIVAAGWWINIAVMAGAALAYADRFVLGSLLSLSDVAFYSTPQELTGRLTVVPVALSSVLLPALGSAGVRDPGDVVRLFSQGMTYTFAILFPIAAAGAAFSPEWLQLWLGTTFSAQSAHATQWLLLSVVLQSLAITPLNLLQAVGRARVTAWLQIVQVPIFIIGLWVAVPRFGIDGAAFVWAARMLLDVTALTVVCRRHVAGLGSVTTRWMFAAPATAVWFVMVVAAPSLAVRAGLLAAALLTFAALLPRLIGAEDLASWRLFLSSRLQLLVR